MADHDPGLGRAALPGVEQSGVGRDLGVAAMEGFTELKNVYIAEAT